MSTDPLPQKPRGDEQVIEPLLTPAEVAALLGISVAEVWSLCRAGDLPAVKLGHSRFGRTRIRPEDLREYQRGRSR